MLSASEEEQYNPLDELPITWQLSLKPLSSTPVAQYYCV